MLKSSPTPILIKTLDLRSNNAVQGLLGSDQILPVPPIVNDIAEAMSWLLEVDFLQCLYGPVAKNLFLVCDWLSPDHINPYDAHLHISLVVANIILYRSFRQEIIGDAMDLIKLHVSERWGERITFAGFRNIIVEIVYIIYNNYCVYIYRNNNFNF